MAERYPGWLRVALVVQFMLPALFWLLAWDHTVSLAQGRSARTVDIVALALPLAAVLLLGTVSIRLWRARQRGSAILSALMPWPLALTMFVLLGAV